MLSHRPEGKENAPIEGKTTMTARRSPPLPEMDSSASDSSEIESEEEDDVISPPRVPRRAASIIPGGLGSTEAASFLQSLARRREPEIEQDLNESTQSEPAVVPPRRRQTEEISSQRAREAAAKKKKKKHQHQLRDAGKAILLVQQRRRHHQQQQQQQQRHVQQQHGAKEEKEEKEETPVLPRRNGDSSDPTSPTPRLPRRRPSSTEVPTSGVRRGDSMLSVGALISTPALPQTAAATTTTSSVNHDNSVSSDTISDTMSLISENEYDTAMAPDIEDLVTLARECTKDCASLVQGRQKRIKTLPELLQALRALCLELDHHAVSLSEYSMSSARFSNKYLSSHLEQLIHVLHATAALVSRIAGSRRLRIDLPGRHSLNRKFRNKVARAARDIDNCKVALVTTLFMALRDSGGGGGGGGGSVSGSGGGSVSGSGGESVDGNRLMSTTESTAGSFRSGGEEGGGGRRRRSTSRRDARRIRAAEDQCLLGACRSVVVVVVVVVVTAAPSFPLLG